jgi:hypothetical protein
MDDSTLDYSKIDIELSALEHEATLLAHKSCRDSPDTAAIGRRRRLDKLNEKRTEEMSKYMNELNKQFGELLKDS